jgi:prevent-host-death family protein
MRGENKNVLTISEVNQDFSRAHKAAAKRPLLITKRGEPTLVLMSYETYVHQNRQPRTLVERLAVKGADEVDVDFPRLGFGVVAANFE